MVNIPTHPFLHAAPLLEGKMNFSSLTLILNIRDPFLQDWSCARGRFPSTILWIGPKITKPLRT